MENKTMYILCECGLSALTVRKLKLIYGSFEELIKDIENLYRLDGSTVQSKKHIRRAVTYAQKIERNSSLYQLIEYGLSEQSIKTLSRKISTLEEFTKLTEKKLKKYFNNKAITDKIMQAKELFLKDTKVELNEINIRKKEADEYLKVKCYLDKMPEGKTKDILTRAWNGEKITDLAQYYRYSGQGIRYFIERESKKIIAFEDKKYSYIFRKYNWKQEEFCNIFKEDIISYYYLKYRYKKYNTLCKNYLELLENENVDVQLKEKIMNFMDIIDNKME